MNYYQIAAIIPFYDENGENSTRIIYADGTTECRPCSVKNFMRSIFYDFHLDPKLISHWTSNHIGAKFNTPMIINEHLIFTPVKFRKGVGKQDGCFGYLGYNHIRSIQDQGVYLSTGDFLPTLSSANYVSKKQTSASLLRLCYLEFKRQFDYIYQQPSADYTLTPSVSS